MEIKGSVFDNPDIVGTLMELAKSKDLKAGARWKVACFYKQFMDTAKTYEEQRAVIIKKYAGENEDGTIATRIENGRPIADIPSDKMEAATAEIKELGEVGIEVAGKKCTISLKDIPEGIISPAMVVALDCIIEFTE